MKQSGPQAKKRFGQNFLHDSAVVNDIIDAGHIRSDDHVIEIGPGQGALTEPMLGVAASVTVIEIDHDLASILQQKHASCPSFKLIEGDVLKVDWTEFLTEGVKYKLIANLPYNISSPLFFKLIRYRRFFESAVIMVQKELAARLIHDGHNSKNLKDYGVLSVVATNVFKVRKVRDVPPACFTPRPKVDSTVVRMEPIANDIPDEEGFFRFTQRLFTSRRKMLLSQIKKNDPVLFESLSEKTKKRLEGVRPENLSPSEFLNLYLGRDLKQPD